MIPKKIDNWCIEAFRQCILYGTHEMASKLEIQNDIRLSGILSTLLAPNNFSNPMSPAAMARKQAVAELIQLLLHHYGSVCLCSQGLSMEPTVPRSAVVKIEKVEPKHIHPGDIVLYVDATKEVVCHRVVRIERGRDGHLFYIVGDNTVNVDRSCDRDIVGRVSRVYVDLEDGDEDLGLYVWSSRYGRTIFVWRGQVCVWLSKCLDGRSIQQMRVNRVLQFISRRIISIFMSDWVRRLLTIFCPRRGQKDLYCPAERLRSRIPISIRDCLSIAPHVSCLRSGQHGVLFHGVVGEPEILNTMAMDLLSMCDGTRSGREIIDSIITQVKAGDSGQIQCDLQDFFESMIAKGYLISKEGIHNDC